MLRVLMLLAVVAGCDDEPRRRTPAAAPAAEPSRPRADPNVAAQERNAAIRTAPFDYKATTQPCPVALPRHDTSPDVTAIEVAMIDNAPPTRGNPGTGYETIVVTEVRGGDQEIGRIFVWDRAAKKMICGTAYNLRSPSLTTILTTVKPLAMIETASIKPAIPDRMPARAGKRAIDVAVGESHFCALVEDGTVRCFGQNDVGQCGDMKGGNFVAKPFKVPGITGGVAIVAGGRHTCVLRKGGTVTCWGSNFSGELGPGRDAVRVTVSQSLGNVTQLVTGSSHTCVLRGDGGVMCWGDSSAARGAWKDKIEQQREPTPRKVKNLAPAAELCASTTGMCARLRAGGVACWGTHYGEKSLPLAGAEQATALHCGAEAFEVCTTDAAHTPTCSTFRGPEKLPASLTNVAWIGIAFDHACALKTDATVECWGKNEWGQLGDGTQKQYPTPVPVRPLPGEPTRVQPLERVKK
ncbi:MAG TPA: hypothetical protein VIV11_07050, partial [Kofleriaceae bacterium]